MKKQCSKCHQFFSTEGMRFSTCLSCFAESKRRTYYKNRYGTEPPKDERQCRVCEQIYPGRQFVSRHSQTCIHCYQAKKDLLNSKQRVCKQCDSLKSLDEFYAYQDHSTRKIQYFTRCKDCERERARVNHHKRKGQKVTERKPYNSKFQRHKQTKRPTCVSREAFFHWREMADTIDKKDQAGFCADCMPGFQEDMKAQGKCNNPHVRFKSLQGTIFGYIQPERGNNGRDR